MNLIAQTHLSLSEIDVNNLDSAYRRATPNMILLALGCQKLLEQIPNVPRNEISFLLGTHFGEVSSTFEFLKTYHDTQVPRPTLFQNSLHNSTLGFATILLGLTGPALTVSTGQSTPESVRDLASNTLRFTPFSLVCFVDSVPDAVAPFYYEVFPGFEKFQNQAYCFLLAQTEAQKNYRLATVETQWDFFKCFI